MTFTPWTLLVDVGLVSGLLLLGKLARARVRFIQKLFIPPSLLAGLAALVLGPNVLGWLPLSDRMGTYASILIALVFSALPLTSGKSARGGGRIGRMWAYSQAGMLLQWALGGLLGWFVLSRIWDIDPACGLAMPAGFCGGHGTAAALGEAFSRYGAGDIQTLAMTAATVGIIASVVVGLWATREGAERGHTAYLSRFADLPPELRSGILPAERRVSMGTAAFSAISLDSMTFNVGVVALIALAGYGISQGIAALWPALMLPVFSCAFLAGILIRALLRRTKADAYLSKPILGHLSGAFTDYLVAFGVASIKLEVVWRYLVPLLILLAVGLVATFLYVFLFGRRFHQSAWFEKSIFTWGWFTGTMAMGIALLRITDPDSKSGTLDDYAYAYLYIAPVEIALVTFAPLLFVQGLGGWFAIACALAGCAILLLSRRRGWLS
ncbi:MAG: sodium:glutamate symporter [Bacteroidales bacterium]|nr:sodium:glutamate symporter [Bacteroidales bacterium]